MRLNSKLELSFIWSLHGDQRQLKTSNPQIEIYFFSSVVVTTWRPLTDTNHFDFFFNKWSFLSTNDTLWQSRHKDVLTSNRRILNFAKKKTKRFRHEIVISASHFRRLNFFIIHFFSLPKHLKKKSFLLTTLRFFFLSFRTLSDFTTPTLLRQERTQVELRI